MMAKIRRLFGGGTDETETAEPQEPTQECQSCGEQYYTNAQIQTCNTCGGVKIRHI